MLKNCLLAFIPVFVAVDAVGVLPLFAAFTEGLNRKEQRRVIFQSMITALSLAVGFLFLGRAVFALLGITIGDFMIAGGALLFGIAITDVLYRGKHQHIYTRELAVVPLGTPLISGPAVLTTTLIIVNEYGVVPTLVSLVVNILLAGVVFFASDGIIRHIGRTGSKALSKITSLLLAAIAIMMIRKGVFYIFSLRNG